MYDIFIKLLKEKGLKPADVTRATGISSAVFSEWKKGKSRPNTDKIIKISKYLGVTVEYLMTGTESFENEIETIPSVNDLKTHIDLIMESLEGKEKIVYDGAEVNLTEQNKKMLRYAMEIAYEAAKNNKMD